MVPIRPPHLSGWAELGQQAVQKIIAGLVRGRVVMGGMQMDVGMLACRNAHSAHAASIGQAARRSPERRGVPLT